MILQFIGFFVVFGLGGFLTFFVGKELYFFFGYQFVQPYQREDFIAMALMVILMCMGLGLMYYAGTHAPFELAFDYNLKIK